MHRRTFVRGFGAALAMPAALRAATPPIASRRVGRIGIQLYTLRDAAKANLEQTLRDIAAAGYQEVELLDSMRNFGMPAAQLRRLLDELHLRAPSTHVSTDGLKDLPRLVRDARTLGHEYLVVASLPLDRKRAAVDDYHRWADWLNAAGDRVRRANLWLAFHNEPEDFVPIGNRTGYDVLVERTDPARVRLQLDTGNAAIGGQDPLALMERYGDRYWLFHLKDAARIGAEHDAELGTGVVDFPRLLARAEPLARKHLYVEQESYPGAPIESARRDHDYLARLTY